MLLRQADSALVALAEVDGQSTDEVHREVGIGHGYALHQVHRNAGDGGRLHGHGRRDVTLRSKVAAIAEKFARTQHAHNLIATAHSGPLQLDTSLEDTDQVDRLLVGTIDVFALAERLIDSLALDGLALRVGQECPNVGEAACEVHSGCACRFHHGYISSFLCLLIGCFTTRN